MSDIYTLSAGQARVCRVSGWLFVLAAAAQASGGVLAAAVPGASWHCGGDGCHTLSRPATLLPSEFVATVASGAPHSAFDDYVGRTDVHLAMAALELVRALPLAAVLLMIGIALACLAARRGDDLARALRWLKRAAGAAVIGVLAEPVAASLMAMLLLPGTPAGAYWYLDVDVLGALRGLLLALAAFAAAWALDAGSRSARDMAEIV